MSNSPTKGYALFDLDQTLVPWDMQLLFANWLLNRQPARRIYLIFFLLALPLNRLLGAERMKRLFLAILHGLSPEELDQLGREFVDHYLPDLLYPEVVALLRQHQEKGDLTILTSASPYFYVRYIGAALGVDHTFGTEVVLDGLFPTFPTGNNKSENKICRLRPWLENNGHPINFPLPFSTSYTDSSADLPLILATKDVVLVNPSKRLLTTVTHNLNMSPKVLRPSRPFNSHFSHLKDAALMLFGLYPVRKK